MPDIDLTAIIKRVEELEAREQIRSVIGRYSRGVDRTEPSVTHECIWPDGRIMLSSLEGTAKDYVDALIGDYVEEALEATHHLIGNIIIDLQDDVAFTESYAVAHHRAHPTARSNILMVGTSNIHPGREQAQLELIIGMRYIDRFERRDGRWKIAERRLVFDWSQLGQYSGIDSGGLYDGTPLRGQRKAADPSNHFRAVASQTQPG